MVSKRKTETEAEPSPPPKKKSTKSAATKKVKRVRDDGEENVVKVKKTKKVKAPVQEEEVDVEEEPSEVSVTPVIKKRNSKSTTPAAKSKSAPKSAVKESTPKFLTPPTTVKAAIRAKSRKSVAPIELPSEEEKSPFSGKKSAKSPIASSSVTSQHTLTQLRNETKRINPNYAEQVSPDDEKEIISLWNQTWNALYMCLTIIGPAFLAIILGCYFMGTMQQSQAIASVGVVYTALFVVIMGSYTLVILPCILVARLFTLIVSSPSSSHTAEEINLYSRLLVLIATAIGMAYYFLHHTTTSA